MAEVQPSLGSIAGVAAFGLQISTSLHTYVEAVWEAKDRLRDVAIDISATASTLKQLQALLDADATLTTKVFRDAGLDEVNNLSVACGKVYSLIVVLLTKAGTPEAQGKIATEDIDVFALKTSILTRHMRWKWLAPRIKRCQGQLRLFKAKLLLNLQLAQLARVQMGIPARQPGAFQEELMLRALSFKLRRQELRTLRLLAKKYNVHYNDAASDVSSLFSADEVEVILVDDNGKPIEANTDEVKPVEAKEESEKTASESSVTADTPNTETVSQTSVDAKPDADNASECGTLVDEPLNEKTDDADLKKVAPEEIVVPTPTETKIEEPEPKELNEKAPPAEEPKPEVLNEKAQIEDTKKEEPAKPVPEHEAIDLPSSSGTFSFLPSWLKDLFGKNDRKFLHDWESPTLECFIVSREFKLLKLPFGHQRLTYGLKRTQRKIGLTWDQYMALDSPHKKEISKAINKAKSLDARQRTCVAIGAQKKSEDDFVVLFLTLGPKVEPIKFKDAVGRQYNVPFENCKTFEHFKKVIDEAFLHVETVGPHALAGHFDLIDSTGTIVLPSLWNSLIKPGDSISMHMWPMSEPPRPSNFFNNGPPPPVSRPGWMGPPRPRTGPPGPPPPPSHGWPGPPRPRPNHFIPPPPPPIIGGPRPPHGGPTLIVYPNRPCSRPRSFSPIRKPTESISVYSWLKGNSKPTGRRRRRYSYSSCSSSSSEDGSTIMSDSDIEDEESDAKLMVDWEKEEEMGKLRVGELLGKWTNAIDTVGGEDLDSDATSSGYSSSGSSSTRSLVDD